MIITFTVANIYPSRKSPVINFKLGVSKGKENKLNCIYEKTDDDKTATMHKRKCHQAKNETQESLYLLSKTKHLETF